MHTLKTSVPRGNHRTRSLPYQADAVYAFGDEGEQVRGYLLERFGGKL